jgi:hypothetical protein
MMICNLNIQVIVLLYVVQLASERWNQKKLLNCSSVLAKTTNKRMILESIRKFHDKGFISLWQLIFKINQQKTV